MALVRSLVKLLFGIFALLVLIGVFLPSEVEVERSVDIDAPASRIFPAINGMKAFNRWSPWADLDPTTQYIFEGPDRGVGSKMTWSSGTAGVGSGSQVIVASIVNERVETEMDFGEDEKGHSTIELLPSGSGTRVRWKFRTTFGWDLFGRYFGLFLDQLLGPSYETGLNNLKQHIEKPRGE